MRVICAYLVVAIHTHPFEDINIKIGFIATQVIPRIAVPFFFTVSGYFYYRHLEKYSHAFRNYTKRLLMSYCVWSSIYFVLNLIELLNNGIFSFKGFFADCIIRFLFLGSYYHLWYFPAIFICVWIMTVFYRLNKLKLISIISILLYFLGVLGCSYNEIAVKIPVVSRLFSIPFFNNIRQIFMMGLPFFMLGYIVQYMVEGKKLKKIGWFLLLISVLFALEIECIIANEWGNNIILTFTLYPLVLCIVLLGLRHPLENIKCVTEKLRKLSGFIYYVHPMIILFLQYKFNLHATSLFLATCFISSIVGIGIIIMDNRILNKLL